MIALLLASIVVIVLLACLWFGLVMLAGIVIATVQNARWLFRRRHGRAVDPAPWQRRPVPLNQVHVPFEVRAAVWARDGGRCVYCGATENMTIDHIVPRAHGGSNDPSNLQLTCAHCNSSKGVRDAPGGSHRHVFRVIERSFEDARRASNGHH